MLKRLLARIRAWLAWRAAKLEPSRINRPALERTPPTPTRREAAGTIIPINGVDYFRDDHGTLWRVRGVRRARSGAFQYLVGSQRLRLADLATGRVGSPRALLADEAARDLLRGVMRDRRGRIV